MDDLLIKYLANELSEEEKILVRNWINDSDQNANYFEKVKRSWELIDVDHSMEKINIDSEWEYFRKKRSAGHLKVVGDEQVSGPEKADFNGTAVRKKIINKKIILAGAIAASVLSILWMGRNIFMNIPGEKQLAIKTNDKIDSSYSVVTRKEINTSAIPKKIRLEDGSEIVLYKNSEVSYKEKFEHNRRNIELTGKAGFSVAKDSTRPFTVLTGDVSTTALGTEFTVSSYPQSDKIAIRLYEGKVVVKSSLETPKKLGREYILLAGTELVYDKVKVNVRVRSFRTATVSGKIIKSNKKVVEDNPSLPGDSGGSWFMFNNQALDEVFDQLANMFQVKIIYRKKEVKRMYFIGKFEKSEELKNILERIATLNGLKVSQENNGFLIQKKN
ncbi:FecR family protein [Terrimonas pollutisoli]|uniref:FecR family protein n=1 Tax=Terrimonas pollutisoli TaxID=3034147 RepID=UPI0023ED7DC3|nr:FecR family protein [Terrimonas sp. H1YJ31]